MINFSHVLGTHVVYIFAKDYCSKRLVVLIKVGRKLKNAKELVKALSAIPVFIINWLGMEWECVARVAKFTSVLSTLVFWLLLCLAILELYRCEVVAKFRFKRMNLRRGREFEVKFAKCNQNAFVMITPEPKSDARGCRDRTAETTRGCRGWKEKTRRVTKKSTEIRLATWGERTLAF